VSRRDESELITKAELTDDEQAYVDQRGMLAQARATYQAMSDEDKASVVEQHGDDQRAAEEQEEDEGVPVEEWLKTATVAEIKEELDSRGVEYKADAKKPELSKLLVDSVHAEK